MKPPKLYTLLLICQQNKMSYLVLHCRVNFKAKIFRKLEITPLEDCTEPGLTFPEQEKHKR